MRAVAALEDWGAVAWLYAELSDGEEAAAAAALELETFADASVLDELGGASAADGALGGGAGGDDEAAAAVAQLELAQAVTLALQAHCERGDVTRAARLLRKKRQQGIALEPAEYVRLWRLARRAARPQPLVSALRPSDVQRSLEVLIEPKLLELQSRASLAAASLGTVERAIAAGLVVAALAAAAAALVAGAGAGAPDTAAADAAGSGFDALTAVPGLYD